MNNKKCKTILLSAMMVSLSSFVAPMTGACSNLKTVCAAQEETQEIYAGISQELHNMQQNTSLQNDGTEETVEEERELKKGYVTVSSLNIRKHPTTNSKALDMLYFGNSVDYYDYNEEWVEVTINGKPCYVFKEYISTHRVEYKSFKAPYTSGIKSFMYHTYRSGKSLFSSKSNQYRLQQLCYTGKYGIRQYKSRYCVALGSAFDLSIGQYFDLVLENGTVIPCIMADQKANAHTDSANIVTKHNGCMSEFIVDRNYLNSNARRMGDISYCCEDWKSRVVEVRTYEKNVLK